ncbi:hypothetical protein ACFLSX_03065 [Calditrichota bacterium]
MNILEEKFIYKDASFRDITLRAYAEYGLYDNVTIIGKVPFKIYRTEYFLDDVYTQVQVSRSTAGFGDLETAIKYGLLRNPTSVSFQGGIKIPLGYKKFPENDAPRLGTSEIDFQGMLLAGQSFHPLPLYASGGVGYRKRGGDLHDEVIYEFETGYTWNDLFFKIYFSGIKNTEKPPDLYGGEIQLPIRGGGGVVPDILYGDQDINQISFSLSYNIEPGMAIEATVFDVLSGKNTIAGQTFSVGFILYK